MILGAPRDEVVLDGTLSEEVEGGAMEIVGKVEA